MVDVAVGHQRGHRAEHLDVVHRCGRIGIARAQQRRADAAGDRRGRHRSAACALPSCSTAACAFSPRAARTAASCARLTSAPMRTPSLRGLPTVVLASRAPIASAAARTAPAARRTRRIAVHFWPDFCGHLARHLAQEQLEGSPPRPRRGQSRRRFRLSASMLTRTERVRNGRVRADVARCRRTREGTTSNGRKRSSRPAERRRPRTARRAAARRPRSRPAPCAA